jgi:CBS domain-containing protein
MVARFVADRTDSLPVVDHHGALLRVVTAVDVERAVSEHSDQATVAATLVRDTPRLHTHQSLEDAVIAFGAGDEEGIPIIGDADDEMIGSLTHRRLLRAYRQRADPPTP